MPAAALPSNEAARAETVRRLELLDTPPEKDFDDIVKLACGLAGVPMALVTLLDETRQWCKASIGMDVIEMPRELAFCAHAILHDEVLVVHDAAVDARFADNPYVLGPPNIRFYAGAPLRAPDGNRIGTLCVLDSSPRTLPPSVLSALDALRRHVETLIALRLRNKELQRSNAELERLRVEKDLLVQFVAHDMKNSLSSILLNADALASVSSFQELGDIGADVSYAARALDRLIFDMLDVSRRERGVSLRVSCSPLRLQNLLALPVAAATHRGAALGVSVVFQSTDEAVFADRNLMVRVVENLLDNALRFSPPGEVVTVRATREAASVCLRITDHGPGIPEERRQRVFSLYEQSESSDPRSRGIGLAFCKVAVEAQGGTIEVEDNEGGGSAFCVRLKRGGS